jgi:hypothetical protein
MDPEQDPFKFSWCGSYPKKEQALFIDSARYFIKTQGSSWGSFPVLCMRTRSDQHHLGVPDSFLFQSNVPCNAKVYFNPENFIDFPKFVNRYSVPVLKISTPVTLTRKKQFPVKNVNRHWCK